MREFRRASDEFRSTVETNLHINDPDPPPPEPTPAVAVETARHLAVASELEPASPETVASRRSRRPSTVSPSSPSALHGCSTAGSARGSRAFAELDRVYLKQVSEALEQGYMTCPVCDPWEPS
jgi:hypothetical protein